MLRLFAKCDTLRTKHASRIVDRRLFTMFHTEKRLMHYTLTCCSPLIDNTFNRQEQSNENISLFEGKQLKNYQGMCTSKFVRNDNTNYINNLKTNYDVGDDDDGDDDRGKSNNSKTKLCSTENDSQAAEMNANQAHKECEEEEQQYQKSQELQFQKTNQATRELEQKTECSKEVVEHTNESKSQCDLEYKDTHSDQTMIVTPCDESEQIDVELRKFAHLHSQDGPFVHSQIKDSQVPSVQDRKRRSMERVPPMPAVANHRSLATSFRRLPKDVILPNEYELRALYPMSTTLPLTFGEAHCVDGHSGDIDTPPLPIKYAMLTPHNFDPQRQYPFLVVLSDGSGFTTDFEDVCVHLFERPTHAALMREQEWVVIAPVIAMRYANAVPNEGVIARFCEWVVNTFNVEHHQVHLLGKGFGANAVLRTVLYEKNVARSVTAILGRLGSPFRPQDWPMNLIDNFNGVHSLVFVPGNLTKVNFIYKLKLMLDLAKVQPPLRNIHFADVFDHQVYYAINPYELWNHLHYFREVDARLIEDQGRRRPMKLISHGPSHLR